MKIQALLLVASTTFLVAPAASQTLLRTINGSAGEMLGGAVIRVGDQNNDGFEDMLVGAPGSNAGRGRIYCVSGAFLATGTGTTMLWSLAPATLAAGDAFGTSLAVIGQLVGNSTPDFVVGAPGDSAGHGAVYLVDGSSHLVTKKHTVGPTFTRFGAAVVRAGDFDKDGKPDACVSAIFEPSKGAILRIRGLDLTSTTTSTSGMSAEVGFASALASADIDGDGSFEILAGSPLFGNQEVGRVVILSADQLQVRAEYSGGIPGEHLGAALDGAHDFDGDGMLDLIVGAPDWTGPGGQQGGRIVALSGKKLLANTAPELFSMVSGQVSATKGVPSWRLGASVRASPDVNGDGFGDIVVGMPGYFTTLPQAPKRGRALVLSGATGAPLGRVTGSANESLGECVLGGLQDLDGDGFVEFVVAGPSCDNPATDSGILRCYRVFPFVAPSVYCTAKVNSLGCFPTIGSSGAPSVSSAAPFLVTCGNLLNKKSGVMIYSHKPAATAFQGAFLCVKTPIKRVGAQSSNGSQTGSDCSGAFSFDFGNQIQSGADPTLVVGAEAFCQFWSRDPQAPSGTSLSNALRFAIQP